MTTSRANLVSSATRKSELLSAADARRVALVAQGFLADKSTEKARAQGAILREIERLGVLQIDSVNVLSRAHYLPIFARVGAYDRALIDAAAWALPAAAADAQITTRALFEYWGHMASLLPVASHRLFRWRMDRAAKGEGTYGSLARFGKEKRAYVKKVLREIEARGEPTAAGELAKASKTAAGKGAGGWWGWSDAKRAVEWLFWAGQLTTSTRRNFERLYDLPERVIPSDVLNEKTPDVETAHRELLAIASRALGIATEDDLCDYFRLSRKEAKPRLLELVEEGTLLPTRVEGWPVPAFLDARVLRSNKKVARTKEVVEAERTALLAPFDSLIWYRPRAERLFHFHYRISIYTPEPQRKHGYYVLPFLLGDDLVARVDLKAERTTSTLMVRSSHAETHADPKKIATPLLEELHRMAAWLGLEHLQIARKGDLAPMLRNAYKPSK